MQYFSNNKVVNFDILRKSGIYSNILLDEIEQGNYKSLNELLHDTERTNKDFMEPILYSVKNEYGTYEVYKYYGENLQENMDLAKEIIKEEPELIENTPISNNKQFILEAAEVNPKVVKYMSGTLKNDAELIQDLCELNNREIRANVAKECKKPDTIIENPELANNREFMKEAVKQDAKTLEYAPENLKNDYKFIRETSKENYEVVEHIISNKEKFGLEAIKGAKDTTREFTLDDCMQIINEMSEKSDDKRYQKVKEKIEKQGIDDVRTMRWVTAMVAQGENISPEMIKKTLDYSILTMSKIQKDIMEDGKEKVSVDNIQELITPQIINKLKEKAIQQGMEIDPELDKKIEEYTEFYNSYNERLKQEKQRNIKKKEQQENKENEDLKHEEIKIELSNIEVITGEASLEGIKGETGAIRKGIETERAKENNVGEITNDDNVERT